MDDTKVVTEETNEKPREKKSFKREKEILIENVRTQNKPSLLDIPKKLPQLHYRWMRNTPDNINLMKAKGYKVANSEQVRASGLDPEGDGSARRGDLILGVEDYKHHRDHVEQKRELNRMNQEQMKRGVKRPARYGGWDFNETIRKG